MLVKDIMTRHVECVGPGTSLREAARKCATWTSARCRSAATATAWSGS